MSSIWMHGSLHKQPSLVDVGTKLYLPKTTLNIHGFARRIGEVRIIFQTFKSLVEKEINQKIKYP